MKKQQHGGIILNMDGAGASGTATPLFAAYGATKRGLAQLGKSLRVGLYTEQSRIRQTKFTVAVIAK